MKASIGIGVLACLIGVPALRAQLVSPATSAAMNSAVAAADREVTLWFGLLRDDQARDAWTRTTPHFKQRMNRETFERVWSPHSGRFQPVVSRRVTAIRYVAPNPPRQPGVVVFDTWVEFRGGTFGGETVALALEAGLWRVSEYAVAPSSNPRDR